MNVAQFTNFMNLLIFAAKTAEFNQLWPLKDPWDRKNMELEFYPLSIFVWTNTTRGLHICDTVVSNR